MSKTEAAQMRQHEDVADIFEDEETGTDSNSFHPSTNHRRLTTDTNTLLSISTDSNSITGNRRLTDSTPDFLKLTGPTEAWAKGIEGEGVVIGIIDSGIWPENESFADDGTYDPLPGYEDLPCC